MPDTTPEISVIICSYNRSSYIINAVNSLFHQTMQRDRFEVVVVDNNSIDNTGELVREFINTHPYFNLHYMTEKRQGASYARNTGAAIAKAPFLCFMDDDAVAEPDFLERIVAFFYATPDATGLGGRIIPKYIPAEPKWMSHYVSSMVGNFAYSPTFSVFKPGKYPLESNMAIRKKDFDAINGFDTNLPGVQGTLRIGGEGKDFFLRLQQRGAKIYYDPAIIVHHVVEVEKLTPQYLYRVASGYGRGEKIRLRTKGKAALLLKTGEYLNKLAGSVVLGVIYALKGEPSKTWPVIKFRIDALKGLLE